MEDSVFNKYLDEIGKEALLSDQEERELSEKILKGDQRALSKLVEANLRFVVTVARQYRGQGVEMEDLVSEGNMGLMKAAAKFDATKGVRFEGRALCELCRCACAPADREGHCPAVRTLSGAQGCEAR